MTETDHQLATVGAGTGVPAEAELDTPHVLKLRGKRVAVGLSWHIVDDAHRLQALTRELAAERKADVWVHRPDGDAQIGLGSAADGHRPGMPSLAAEIASSVHGDWAGIFEVGGYYYLLAAHNGTIEADTDVAIDDLPTAIRLFRELSGRSVSRFLASPSLLEADLGVRNVEPFDLDEKLPAFRYRLKRTSAFGAVFRVARPFVLGGVALVALTFMFPDQWTSLKQRVGLEQAPEKAVLTIAPMPWTGQPKAKPMLAHCVAALAAVPRDAGGWHGSKATCDGRRLTLTVGRQGSVTDKAPPITWLDRWVASQGDLRALDGVALGKAKVIKLSSGQAELAWAIPAQKERWLDRDVSKADVDAEMQLLWRRAEAQYLRSSFAAQPTKSTYNVTLKSQLAADMTAILQMGDAIDRPLATISATVLDLERNSLVVDLRLHKSLPIPRSDDKTTVERSPDPSTLERGPLPPPEP